MLRWISNLPYGLGGAGLLLLAQTMPGLGGPPPALASFAALPLAFEPLAGQAQAPALFLARGCNYQFRIAPAQAQLILCKSERALTPSAERAQSVAGPWAATRTIRMDFAGANPQAPTYGEGAMPGTINYLLDGDPAQWRTGITTFAKVRVQALYPGISLVYYGNHQRLEYDFTIAPGADPATIAIHYEGVDRLALNEAGDLLLGLGAEEVCQPRPALYQTVGGQRKPVSGGYRLKDARTATFAAGQYDHSSPLVIDPTMNYSTYFGGNGDDIVWAVKVNTNDNSIYLAGQTLSSQFPFGLPAPGAQATNAGGTINGDAFVARLDRTGTNLLFFTFLGGSGDDAALDLALDGAGRAYLTGYTDSTNFPCLPAGGVPGLLNSTNLSGRITPAHVFFSDAFVAELTSDGSGLVFSSYLGGSDRDAGIGIALDPSNFVYVTGYTYSTNFPATNALVVQPPTATKPLCFTNLFGSNDVFVTKFAPAGAKLVYSTYLGGTNFDVGQGIAADAGGNAYVTGYTASTNFPVTTVLAPLLGQLNDTTNAVRKYNGRRVPPYDAFVAKIAPLGSDLLYCAYLGGTNNDAGFRIRLDAAGALYLTGSSSSLDFPNLPSVTTNLIPRGLTNLSYLNSDAFLTKIVAPGNVPVIEYSLLFGGPGNETGWDLALDPLTTNIFLVGTTTSTNFPSFPFSATNAPFLQATNRTRSNDVFVAAFAPATFLTTNSVLTNLFAVCFGGVRDDFGLGIDVDRAGNAFVAGQTLSGDFPTLGACQPTLVGHSDGFLARIQFADALAAVTIDTVPPHLQVTVDGTTNTAPLTADWVFGSAHSLSTLPVQGGGPGTRHIWTSWSHGGLLSNRVSPATSTVAFTASFKTQYFLTMQATQGGAANPASGWYDAGTVVPITATPALGASFAGWTSAGAGAYSGSNNPGSVTMNGPITEVANFTGALGNRLTVVINGAGSVSPDYNGQALLVGHTYTLTAKPNPGFSFAGWTGDVPTNNPVLRFVMTNGLVLQANFAANPFAPAKGSYAGLFFDTNNLDFQSSGFFGATLADSGAFSATLQPAGKTYSLSGQFSNDGAFYGTLGRGSRLTRLQVRLQLDLSGGNRLTGQVSDGTWSADLLANRAVYSNTNPAPERSRKYVLRLAGSDNSLAAPGGEGFGTASVDAKGGLLFNGTLGDGAKVLQSTFVSGQGQWPLFASLYSGRGAVLGWLSFVGPALDVLSGPVIWFKVPNPGPRRLYPGGYTFETQAAGSVYAFTNGTRVLNFSQGQVVLEKGGLLQDLTNRVLLDLNNKVTDLTRTNRLSLSLSPAAGSFRGSFLNPATGQAVPFSGALLPSQTNGAGFFLTTNQSGRVFFGP